MSKERLKKIRNTQYRIMELSNTNMQSDFNFLLNYIDVLKQQNKHYRETLEFYANRENYNPKHYDPNSDNGYMSTIDYDEGEKARQALEVRANESK